ncbi:MAG: hypothetical protein ACK56I_31270, partial [bacterium]
LGPPLAQPLGRCGQRAGIDHLERHALQPVTADHGQRRLCILRDQRPAEIVDRHARRDRRPLRARLQAACKPAHHLLGQKLHRAAGQGGLLQTHDVARPQDRSAPLACVVRHGLSPLLPEPPRWLAGTGRAEEASRTRQREASTHRTVTEPKMSAQNSTPGCALMPARKGCFTSS